MKAFDLSNFNSIRPIVRRVLRYKKAGSVLDLGCGIGRHALFLAKRGFRVVAVDNRVEALAVITELARLQKLPITTRPADVVRYAPGKKFDVVLSNMVLHFLPKRERVRMLSTMQRSTKPGGLNVLSAYTHKNKPGTRLHLIKAGELKQAYENAGWKVLDYQEGLSERMIDVFHKKKVIRFWKEEIIAQKKDRGE